MAEVTLSSSRRRSFVLVSVHQAEAEADDIISIIRVM